MDKEYLLALFQDSMQGQDFCADILKASRGPFACLPVNAADGLLGVRSYKICIHSTRGCQQRQNR